MSFNFTNTNVYGDEDVHIVMISLPRIRNIKALHLRKNAKFKVAGGTDFVNVNEIVIRVYIESYKHMNGGTALPYIYTEDEDFSFGKNGNTSYGTAKYETSIGKGQAFWYDADMTALKDLSGSRT